MKLSDTHCAPCAGADLANLLNEAAILAGRREKKSISLREVDDSVDRIVAGAQSLIVRPVLTLRASLVLFFGESCSACRCAHCNSGLRFHIVVLALLAYAQR